MTSDDCRTAIKEKGFGFSNWKRVQKSNDTLGDGVLRVFYNGKKYVAVLTDPTDTSIKEIKELPQGEIGKEFYFQEASKEDSEGIIGGVFYIVSKEFYDTHHHLDDDGGAHNTILPPGFTELMESIFEFDGPRTVGRLILLLNGYEEKKMV